MAYIFQAPKDFDAQSAPFKRKHKDLGEVAATGRYVAQLKYDGVFSVTYTSREEAFSRQQEPQPSAGNLAIAANNLFGGGKLVFMELWVPGTPHRTLNGWSRKQSLQPQLLGKVFDMITLDEFNAGVSKRPYEDRLAEIAERVKSSELLSAAENAMPLVQGITHAEIVDKARRIAGNEVDVYDGIVMRDTQAIWTPGASKHGEVIKVKADMSLDLRVVDQSVSVRETKLGGYVTVIYNGVPTDVGSGLVQKQLHAMMDGKLDLRGKVVEIECLGITAAGKLREPRIKAIRHDALPEEEK